jgi:hypothetical protein
LDPCLHLGLHLGLRLDVPPGQDRVRLADCPAGLVPSPVALGGAVRPALLRASFGGGPKGGQRHNGDTETMHESPPLEWMGQDRPVREKGPILPGRLDTPRIEPDDELALPHGSNNRASPGARETCGELRIFCARQPLRARILCAGAT